MKKELSASEARVKAEAYCSASEHCKADVLAKLQQWGAPETAWPSILSHLESERYIDEQRYAIFFVRDKYRFNQWGKVKIIQALRFKHLSPDCIAQALESIDEDEYLDILATLLRKKARTVKGASDYERRGKLLRFAAGHGYEMHEILRCLEKMGYDDEPVD